MEGYDSACRTDVIVERSYFIQQIIVRFAGLINVWSNENARCEQYEVYPYNLLILAVKISEVASSPCL